MRRREEERFRYLCTCTLNDDDVENHMRVLMVEDECSEGCTCTRCVAPWDVPDA